MADDDSINSEATPPSPTPSEDFRTQLRISRHYISENEQLRARANRLEAQLGASNLWNQLSTHRVNERYLVEQENARQASQDNDTLREEIEALKHAIGGLQARYDGLEAQSKQEKKTSREEIEALKENVASLTQQIEGLQLEVESAEIGNEQAIASQQAAYESLAVEQQKNEMLRQEIATHIETNATLQARCDGLQFEKEALAIQKKQENEMSLHSVASLREETAELKHTNSNLLAEKDALEVQSKQEKEMSRQEIAELKHANEHLRTRCNELQSLHYANVLSSTETIQSLREINSRLLATLQETRERYDSLMFEQQVDADKNIDELQTRCSELTLRNDNLEIEMIQLERQLLEETSSGIAFRGSDDQQPTTAVTPAHPSKRDQSMTATTKSSSAVSTSPKRKKARSNEITSNAEPEPPASVMPVDDSDESMMNMMNVDYGVAMDEDDLSGNDNNALSRDEEPSLPVEESGEETEVNNVAGKRKSEASSSADDSAFELCDGSTGGDDENVENAAEEVTNINASKRPRRGGNQVVALQERVRRIRLAYANGEVADGSIADKWRRDDAIDSKGSARKAWFMANHTDDNGNPLPNVQNVNEYLLTRKISAGKFGQFTLRDLVQEIDSIAAYQERLTGQRMAVIPHPTGSIVGKSLKKNGSQYLRICEMVHLLIDNANKRDNEYNRAVTRLLKEDTPLYWAGSDRSHLNGAGHHRYQKSKHVDGYGATLLMMSGIPIPPSLRVPVGLTHLYDPFQTALEIAKIALGDPLYELTNEFAKIQGQIFQDKVVGSNGDAWRELEGHAKSERNAGYNKFVAEAVENGDVGPKCVHSDYRDSIHIKTVDHQGPKAREIKWMHTYERPNGKVSAKSPNALSYRQLQEQKDACAKARANGEDADLVVKCCDCHCKDDLSLLSKVLSGEVKRADTDYHPITVNRKMIERNVKVMLALARVDGIDLNTVSSIDELYTAAAAAKCMYSRLPLPLDSMEIVDGHHPFECYDLLLLYEGYEYEFKTAKRQMVSWIDNGDDQNNYQQRLGREFSVVVMLLKSAHMMTHKVMKLIESGSIKVEGELPFKIDKERKCIIIDALKYPQFQKFLPRASSATQIADTKSNRKRRAS